MLEFIEIPSIEDGYLLEPSKGWFSVVVPTAKQNLIVNPNFVNYPTITSNITVTNATATASNNGVFAPSALLISLGTNGYMKYDLNLFVSGQYTFSAYVRSTVAAATLTVTFETDNVSKSFNISNDYQRISFTHSFDALNAIRISCTSNFEITSMQLEEGRLTTFFSGDQITDTYDPDDAYKWAGEKYKSYSIRSGDSYSGGELVSLYEYGFKVTSIEGLGYPDLSPITYDQALYDSILYACSNIEQREISINGIITSNSFYDFSRSRGNIGKLLYHRDRPSRIYFTPYEYCDSDTPCIYFDFLYTTGLNDEVSSLFGQELSIQGITLSPCVYSCMPYEFSSITLNDMKVSTSSNDLFFITDDDQPMRANLPQYTLGANYRVKLIDAVTCGGVLYVLVEQSAGGGTDGHFLSYADGTWTRIATVAYNPNAGTEYNSYIGMFGTLECVPTGEFTEGIWVGGYFEKYAVNYDPDLVLGLTLEGVANGNSLFIYKPEDRVIQSWDIVDTNYTSQIGAVNDISYNPNTGNIYVAGVFTDFQEGNLLGSFSTDNIFQVNVVEPFISLINGGSGISFSGSGGATGGTHYYDTSQAQIRKVFETDDYVYILTNGYIGSYNVLTNTQSFFIRYNKADNSIDDTAFPFVSETLATTANGAMVDMYEFRDMLVATGRFTQANSNFIGTNPNYNSGHDYISNITYFDPEGYSPGLEDFLGLHKPLQYPEYTLLNDDVASGVYDDDTNDPNPLAADASFVQIDELNGNLLFYGFIGGYGLSTDKKSACGFVEYLPQSYTDLSRGIFLPPSLDIVTSGLCWPAYKSINNVFGLKAIVGNGSFPLVTSVTFLYNSGMQIDTCGSETTVDIIVDSDDGINELYGIRNLTTGKYIYFEPMSMTADKLFRMSVIDNILYFVYSSGNTVKPSIIDSNGNPLLVNDGHVVQALFNLSGTNAIGSNPSFTAKYKKCYFSFDELMVCENDN